MDQWMRENREKLQAAYGTMSQEDTSRMKRTIERFEEDQPMKKKMISSLALVLLLLALAGAALALAGSYGVLDFLRSSPEADSPLAQSVQTEFSQTGGDMSDVTVRVRDAVADGVTLVLSVEMKAKNPADVLMKSEDKTGMLLKEQGNDFGPMTGRDPNMPDWSAFPEDQNYLYMSEPIMTKNEAGEYENPQAFIIGSEYYYEDAQTIVSTILYDITGLPEDAETLSLPFTVSIYEITGTRDTDNEGNPLTYEQPIWDYRERTNVVAEVRLGDMTTKTFAIEEPVLKVGELQYRDVTFTVSPYAMYFECIREDNPDEPDASTLITATEGTTLEELFFIQDDQGRKYEQLWYAFVSTSAEREAENERERFIYTAHGAPYPEALTIRGFYERDSNQVYEVTVPLVEAPEANRP